uniref:Uncharacterized protein n=1 Tax=Campylobacter jejuni TaxID=197 RepID=Q9EZ85_CAMJU|nr:unknown [Campylobacter jejuni]
MAFPSHFKSLSKFGLKSSFTKSSKLNLSSLSSSSARSSFAVFVCRVSKFFKRSSKFATASLTRIFSRFSFSCRIKISLLRCEISIFLAKKLRTNLAISCLTLHCRASLLFSVRKNAKPFYCNVKA